MVTCASQAVWHLLQTFLLRILLVQYNDFTVTLCRNSKLSEQLQALKKKEAEETKALEDMVAKVEENLVASTVSIPVCACACPAVLNQYQLAISSPLLCV